MYKNKASSFAGFKKKLLDGTVELPSKTYFSYNADGQTVKITSDTLLHVNDEHHLSDNEWTEA